METENLRQSMADQQIQPQDALANLRQEIAVTLVQQRAILSRQRAEIDEAIAQQQAAFEQEIAAFQTQTVMVQNELEQRIDELTAQVSNTGWQRIAEQQRQHLATLTTHLQQAIEAQEQQAEQILQLHIQLAEHQIARERDAHLLGQLAQQVSSLTRQLSEQKTRYELEARTREQLMQHMSLLAHQASEQAMMQENAHQQVLAVLAQQQDQIASLHHHVTEHFQHSELLSQLYAASEQRDAEIEQQIADLYQLLEQQRRASYYPGSQGGGR
ncbi:MAG: hypothetical protein H0W02_08090 [Ktedonobacteraceae bacterium]|nr:hypothetical protein [Ktedonobacteraceae bacterium]